MYRCEFNLIYFDLGKKKNSFDFWNLITILQIVHFTKRHTLNDFWSNFKSIPCGPLIMIMM